MKFSEKKINSGFTLAEILVVIAITAIIGTILVAIFTNTLRGSNKSQILAVIKQNGQAVLENVDKTIRSADYVLCPVDGTSGNTALIKNADGSYTRYRIALPIDPSGTAPGVCIGSGKNGCIVWDNPAKSLGETDNQFIARVCTDPMFSGQILTDTNPQTGVQIVSGYFANSKPAGFNNTVTINFTLKPGSQALPIIVSQIDPVTFQTTIECRNCLR